MPRRSRPPIATRSEHWLRVLINQKSDLIDQQLNANFGWNDEKIDWKSPLAADDYAEYYDESFLHLLGVSPRESLKDFWPSSGPRWDGLGATQSGKIILIEAKAHIAEIVSSGSKASAASKVKILGALNETKAYCKVEPDVIWDGPFYQYANRLAHLYWLAVRNEVDAYLIFVDFVGAPDVPASATKEQWQGANLLTRTALGLGQHPLRHRISEVFIDVSQW